MWQACVIHKTIFTGEDGEEIPLITKRRITKECLTLTNQNPNTPKALSHKRVTKKILNQIRENRPNSSWFAIPLSTYNHREAYVPIIYYS